MTPTDKPLAWLHGEVKTPPFSAAARLEAGLLLRQLQQGVRLGLPHSRPMPSIGRRCHELRIPDADQTWRLIYRLDPDAVVIAEVFSTKTAATPARACHLPAAVACLRCRGPRLQGGSMNKTKRAHLAAAGWRIGSAADFLELSAEEAAFVETKLALSESLRARRAAQHLSQAALAKRLKSSQSRVAKMEAADPTVSVDLLLRGLFALGATPKDVAKALRTRRATVAA
jgi:phage-related protein